MAFDIPDSFRTSVVEGFGEKGSLWLTGLPDLLSELADTWQVKLGAPLDGLKGNYVAFAETRAGTELVLKVGVPHLDLRTEIEALDHYQGRGIVRSLESLPEKSALLLERLTPGTRLNALGNNAEETRIAARAVLGLRTSPPDKHDFPDWMDRVESRFRKGREALATHPEFPADWISRAEDAVAHCRATNEPDVLLHGDLHHLNILYDDKRGWTPIDPKGVVGHPALEIGRFSFNFLHVPAEKAKSAIEERIAIFGEELQDTRAREHALVDVMQCRCEQIGKPDNGWKTLLHYAAGYLVE